MLSWTSRFIVTFQKMNPFLLSQCQTYLAYFSAIFQNRRMIKLVMRSFMSSWQTLILTRFPFMSCGSFDTSRNEEMFTYSETKIQLFVRSSFMWYIDCSYLFPHILYTTAQLMAHACCLLYVNHASFSSCPAARAGAGTRRVDKENTGHLHHFLKKKIKIFLKNMEKKYTYTSRINMCVTAWHKVLWKVYFLFTP